MANSETPSYTLRTIDRDAGHEFKVPVKRINDGDDVSFFLTSKAYTDIMTFIFQLNGAMFPQKSKDGKSEGDVKAWTLKDTTTSPPEVFLNLAKLVKALENIIDEAPPDPGPRRFGNVSFRKWYEIVQERIPGLLDEYLPSEILSRKSKTEVTARAELEAYLMGSFGSAQRLDYGTGHELSFLAFLGGLWKLLAFPTAEDGSSERFIVLGVIEPYLELIRRLILTYTLEPAGSHGVWGLDDHSFLPYIFGSAQFSPAIARPSEIVTEGSLPNAPNPADVAKAPAVERERGRNMYFSAIGFIYDVKKGPFWEHSPILFDISGVKAGWAKINKGMLKMYNAEVLSKFPVVQHFPFGSLFTWETDPSAKKIQASIHTASQPKSNIPTARPQPSLRDPMAEPSMSNASMPPVSGTAAPWASSRVPSRHPASVPVPAGPNQPTRVPWASSTPLPPPGGGAGMRAPWASGSGGRAAPASTTQGAGAVPSTRAPWADKKS